MALALWLLVLAAGAAIAANVLISWQYPQSGASDTNLTFELFASGSLTLPFVDLTNIVANSQSNYVGSNVQYSLAIQSPYSQEFYYMVATSSFWSLAVTSSVLSTPSLPQHFGPLLVVASNTDATTSLPPSP